MKDDEPAIYAQCMTKVRQRIGLVRWLYGTNPLGENTMLTGELVFVQFRKILELIAFSSLTANREKYADANRRAFRTHWKAKLMLDAIEKINPRFYPVPLNELRRGESGRARLTQRKDGFLTRREFEKLYDASAEVLHMRNPFSDKNRLIRIDYDPLEYAMRIQNLVSSHMIRLVDDRTSWIVTVPQRGEVQMIMAEKFPHAKAE